MSSADLNFDTATRVTPCALSCSESAIYLSLFTMLKFFNSSERCNHSSPADTAAYGHSNAKINTVLIHWGNLHCEHLQCIAKLHCEFLLLGWHICVRI